MSVQCKCSWGRPSRWTSPPRTWSTCTSRCGCAIVAHIESRHRQLPPACGAIAWHMQISPVCPHYGGMLLLDTHSASAGCKMGWRQTLVGYCHHTSAHSPLCTGMGRAAGSRCQGRPPDLRLQDAGQTRVPGRCGRHRHARVPGGTPCNVSAANELLASDLRLGHGPCMHMRRSWRLSYLCES